MSDHIEEVAMLSSLLTLIAARIEALKLRHQAEALKTQVHELNKQLAKMQAHKEGE